MIKFIGSDELLAKLIVLNKESRLAISRSVYKQALIASEPERLQAKRISIWRILMQLQLNTSDYYAFKQKVIQNPHLIRNVEEVIELDVQRSAHSMPELDMQSLTFILKTYAYYNPEIEYC